MDWIFAHFKIVLAIGMVVYYWVKKFRDQQTRREAEDYDREQRMAERAGNNSRPVGDRAAEVEERTKRIQEEIRRKILERQSAAQARPSVASPVVRPAAAPPPPVPMPVRRTEPATESPYAQQMASEPQSAAAEMLDRQRQLLDQLRAIEQQKAAAARISEQHATVVPGEAAAYDSPEQKRAARVPVFAELKDRQALRRAVVLREVLSPPVGLR
jgi:hypothetical protein